MIFFIISFIAGLLTVLTPCVLPILPIVLGSAVVNGQTSRRRSFVVIGSLIASVFIFTFLLRVSTALIMVPLQFWTYLSGGIIFIFGLSLIQPDLWGKISASLFVKSNTFLNQSYQNRGKWWGDMILGVALGPIFTTCSPTFFVILATVLPASLALGTIYLIAYCFGLALALLLIAFLGQKVLLKFANLADPKSNFKKIIGWIFIILAILIATGIIKKIETKILDAGFFDFTKIERNISEFLDKSGEKNIEEVATSTNILINEKQIVNKQTKKATSDYKEFKYREIVSPSGFVNSAPFKLADLVGKKVILLDFMTYSCINCQRTYPYLNAWYQKYKNEGLEIVGIHTPEFAFEKNIKNVEKAALEFELKFPLVLDNDYATWGAYENRYWPHKYLIDINGNIVYDHIGEGGYDETENKIKELLKERAEKMGTYVSEGKVSVVPYFTYAKSPETYFGSLRNSNFGNGTSGKTGEQKFVLPDMIVKDKFYFSGIWNITSEYAENIGAPVELVFKFDAKEVYLVAEANAGGLEREIEVYIDGSMTEVFKIKDSKLYHIISLPYAGEHTLRIVFKNPQTRIYAFTFG